MQSRNAAILQWSLLFHNFSSQRMLAPLTHASGNLNESPAQFFNGVPQAACSYHPEPKRRGLGNPRAGVSPPPQNSEGGKNC